MHALNLASMQLTRFETGRPVSKRVKGCESGRNIDTMCHTVLVHKPSSNTVTARLHWSPCRTVPERFQNRSLSSVNEYRTVLNRSVPAENGYMKSGGPRTVVNGSEQF